MGEDVQNSDLVHFLVGWSKSEKLSEIKSLLVQIQDGKPVSLIYVREL